MGGFWSGARKLFFGSPAKRENVSNLRPEQEQNYENLQNAAKGKGAGGAAGDTADYYRGLLSDDSADYNAFAAPQMRSFNEDIIPGLSEQFAGMGAGGLSSSSFRNAAVNAGTDLSERLGQIRANLRQRGAEGLQSINQQALQPYSTNMETEAATQGLAAPVLGAVTTAVGGPALGAIGAAGGNYLSNQLNSFGAQKVGGGSKDPYQSGMTPPQQSNGNKYNLPNRAF